MQLDPEGNRLAGTKPRDLQTFSARWQEIFKDPRVTARVILVDGALVGSIGIFPQEGVDSIGYWVAREHWGRGIATRALGLMLAESPIRPLHAHVAAHNPASRRALERNAFVLTERRLMPATERYEACELLTLVLA
jgi:RimJ/RimL family protein N-acetyltransferase